MTLKWAPPASIRAAIDPSAMAILRTSFMCTPFLLPPTGGAPVTRNIAQGRAKREYRVTPKRGTSRFLGLLRMYYFRPTPVQGDSGHEFQTSALLPCEMIPGEDS